MQQSRVPTFFAVENQRIILTPQKLSYPLVSIEDCFHDLPRIPKSMDAQLLYIDLCIPSAFCICGLPKADQKEDWSSLKKKNARISVPTQLKPLLFKDQLYFQILKASCFQLFVLISSSGPFHDHELMFLRTPIWSTINVCCHKLVTNEDVCLGIKSTSFSWVETKLTSHQISMYFFLKIYFLTVLLFYKITFS